MNNGSIMDYCCNFAEKNRDYEENEQNEQIEQIVFIPIQIDNNGVNLFDAVISKSRRKRQASNKGWETIEKKMAKKPAKRAKIVPQVVHKVVQIKKDENKVDKVDQTKEKRTLVLKNLPYNDVYLVDLMEIFDVYGKVEEINILRNPNQTTKGIAFVRFETNEGSENVVNNMTSFEYGGRAVYVEYARPRL